MTIGEWEPDIVLLEYVGGPEDGTVEQEPRDRVGSIGTPVCFILGWQDGVDHLYESALPYEGCEDRIRLEYVGAFPPGLLEEVMKSHG